LIIWDRLFGTFQEEEERPTYGITTPIKSYNPITLNFHEWRDITLDVIKSRSLKEAYAMMFTNPSKLEGVKAKFNSLNLKKYEQLEKTDIDFVEINNLKSKKGLTIDNQKI
jgi:hypothetical protein